MSNDHYVPQLVLRNFSNKTRHFVVDENGVCRIDKAVKTENISIYDVKKKTLLESVSIKWVYASEQFYSDEVEEKLNKKIESQFGRLFNKKLINCDKVVEINRQELLLIKKFLLISVLRAVKSEDFIKMEKSFYDISEEKITTILKSSGKAINASDDEIKGIKERFKPPFEEEKVEGESIKEYWFRTLNVILESDGSPQGIMEQKMKIYPAFRWANVINAGYLAFWDAASPNDEFVITDIGMTSENEKGWNGITTHNSRKTNFLIDLCKTIFKMKEISNKEDEKECLNQLLHQVQTQLQFVVNFHENFQMYPISANRMIVLIAPYYKFIDNLSTFPLSIPYPDLKDLTMLPNRNLFEPNDAKYINSFKDFQPDYHDDDKYIYEIKELNRDEIRYCNSLFLDRVDTTLGFSSLSKIAGSVFYYRKITKYPLQPRVDYSQLYKIIIKRNIKKL